ncbi:MAG: HypC/HybG/HupF family hydrogenase formation chaperone [Caldimicrobium sp.]
MCLAFPYEIVEILGPFTAKASCQGVVKEIYTSLLPEPVAPGDWVLVHVGFAIQKINLKEAQEILKTYNELYTE